MTHDDQIKPKLVQYLVKRETALPSLKDDCHPCPAHFGNHQFPIREDKEVEKNTVKTMESLLFDAGQPIQVPSKKPITRNAKTLIQKIFSDAGNEDAVERRKPKDNIPYQTDLVLVHKVDYEQKTTTSLKNNRCTSENCNDPEDEKLHYENYSSNKYICNGTIIE